MYVERRTNSKRKKDLKFNEFGSKECLPNINSHSIRIFGEIQTRNVEFMFREK